MKNTFNDIEKNSIFIVKSSFFITIMMLLFLMPFSINNFFQGRIELGLGSLVIVILCAINGWNCLKNKFQPLIILAGIVPFIIVFLVLSFREQGIIGVFWSYPAALVFYFMLPGRHAWLANVILIALVVPEAWKILEPALAIRFAVTLVTISMLAGIFIWFITKQQYKLRMMATTDPLTQLNNRTDLDTSLDIAIKDFKKKGNSATIIMLDLDHFKSINDSLGHYAGDDVLRGVGRFLNTYVTGNDKAFRIGGEEFIVLMPSCSIANAMKSAEEIRVKIEQLDLLTDRKVTTSIGVASLKANDTIGSWMRRCDENLYQAKQAGRNQVFNN